MKIFVNQIEQVLSRPLHLDQFLDEITPKKPYAIAVNGIFIPRTDYSNTPLKDQDSIEIIAPVTGG